MIKAVALIFPLVGTASLFLVLYNNSYHGLATLMVLAILNVAIILIPRKRFPVAWGLEWAKASALCAVAALVALVGLEMLFPRVLPHRFNEVMDLSKDFMVDSEGGLTRQHTVFPNAEQRTLAGADRTGCIKSGFKFWHAPGRQFTYYGYDPNSQTSYVNRFLWNSKGYFDHDYGYQAAEGVRRVVIIGDSYVEAVQVPLARTFHKIVETELNRGAVGPDQPRIEVIALGSSGTGQVEHLKVLQEEAIRYSPDMVVVALCSNDFCDDDPALKQELVLAAGGVTPRLRGLVSHGYFALGFAAKRLEDIRRNRVAVSPELLQWSRADIPRIEAAWSRTLHCIRTARDFCHARGIEFVLLYVGSEIEVKFALDPVGTLASLKAMGGPHAKVEWDLGKSLRRINSFAEEHDIVLISLLEPMIAAQKEDGRSVFGDHYTMFGHQVAATVLTRAVDFRMQTHLAARPDLKHAASPESAGELSAGPPRTVSYDAATVGPN